MLKSVRGLLPPSDTTQDGTSQLRWTKIVPDEHGDWIKQRDTSFSTFIAIGGRDIPESGRIFTTQSGGIKSNRDVWAFNSSRTELERNIRRTIAFYDGESQRIAGLNIPVGSEVETTNDSTKISWTRGLRDRLRRRKALTFNPDAAHKAFYRPFTREWVYLDSALIEVMSRVPSFFPKGEQNVMIWTTGIGATVPFSCWISDTICSLQQGPAAVQHFPRFIYDSGGESESDELFDNGDGSGAPSGTQRDAITDAGLAHFQAAYPGEAITKEDLFYYIYGLLHSPDYRSRYADNLGKELPRIPAVKAAADFRAFSRAGRELAHWHLHYETVDIYPGAKLDTGKVPRAALKDADYRVTKMKFAKTRDPKTQKPIPDKTTVIYNERITISDIPLEAYDYVVNGKPALEWVMERQAVTTDKDSGIVNDANLWATETVGNAKYPLELFLRVVTVSLETMKIVRGLPALHI